MKQVIVLLGPQRSLYGAGKTRGAAPYKLTRPEFGVDLFEVRADAYSNSKAGVFRTMLG